MEKFKVRHIVNCDNKKKALKYLIGYLKELKMHFNLKDGDIISILGSTYFEIHKQNVFQKCSNVIKSLLH